MEGGAQHASVHCSSSTKGICSPSKTPCSSLVRPLPFSLASSSSAHACILRVVKYNSTTKRACIQTSRQFAAITKQPSRIQTTAVAAQILGRVNLLVGSGRVVCWCRRSWSSICSGATFCVAKVLNLVVLWFGVVALCFVITTRVLRSVLGKTIVMVLLCHSSECGCFVCFA